ncbi:unnamed protein product [Darwinula stevensoni]|uniref:Semaphorin-1A n=1 Tax=Darwinula stevensoni TaxID=69355 RepID=A0A7R9A9U8_9CRUS|nr:unnamed protein product [Darwinula stevensoni]CAG0897781.1 unnamed protein product [Darwinula stevensoni]
MTELHVAGATAATGRSSANLSTVIASSIILLIVGFLVFAKRLVIMMCVMKHMFVLQLVWVLLLSHRVTWAWQDRFPDLKPKATFRLGHVQKLRQDFGYPRQGKSEHDFDGLRNPSVQAGMQRYGWTRASDPLDKRLYVGTVLDFGGLDPVIYRKPREGDENDYPLRTEQYDLKQFNDPQFVNSMEDDHYVYFFFRERACEVSRCAKVPIPRPGSKEVNDTTLLTEYASCFFKLYPFMYDHVQPLHQQPIFVISQDKNNARLNRIVVDERITGVNGSTHDVIFAGTDDGRVLKIIYNEDEVAEKVNAVVIEDSEVLGMTKRVVNMYRYREEGKPAKIVVIGDELIKALPVHRCDLVKTCSDCVKLQDPYCAWDTMDKGHCTEVANGSNEIKLFRYVQDIRSGNSSQCPQLVSHSKDAGESKGTMHNDFSELLAAGATAATGRSLDKKGKILITAVVCSVVCLMAGFLVGSLFTRKFRKIVLFSKIHPK